MRALILALGMLWSGMASASLIVEDFEAYTDGEVIGSDNCHQCMEVFWWSFPADGTGRLQIKSGSPLPNAGRLSAYFDGVGGHTRLSYTTLGSVTLYADTKYRVVYDATPGVEVILAWTDIGGFPEVFRPRDWWYLGENPLDHHTGAPSCTYRSPTGDSCEVWPYIGVGGTAGWVDNIRFVPVPTPATVVILLSGLMLAAAVRQRR